MRRRHIHGIGIPILACVIFVAMAGPVWSKTIFDDDWTPPAGGKQAAPPPSKPRDPRGASTPQPSDAPRATSTSLLPIPGPAEQSNSRTMLREVYSTDLRDHSSQGLRRLGATLLDAATNPAKGAGDRFVLFMGALDAGREVADLSFCQLVIGKLASIFAVDGPELEVRVALNMSLTSDVASANSDNCRAGLAIVDRLVSQERFTDANHLLTLLRWPARQDPKLTATVTQRQQEVESLVSQLAKIKTAPDDPAANLAVGSYRCFERADWPGGLPLLAKSNDPVLAPLAKLELTKPTDPATVTSLGDGWYDLGDRQPDPSRSRSQILLHADTFYSRVVDTATGLARAKLLIRLKQIEQGPAPAAPIRGGTPDSSAGLPFALIASAIRAGNISQTDPVGGKGGGPFTDVPPEGAILIGATVTTKKYAGHTIISSVQPIYRMPAGRIIGTVHGHLGKGETTLEAKPGYAVGDITARGGGRLDGFEMIFMKIKPGAAGLDPADTYASDWAGGKGGGESHTLTGDGKFIIGLAGHTGADFDSIRLVTTK
jgi:hypothetical protein